MSDSSSSEEEGESRFKAVCDPTLWRTAAEGRVKDSHSPPHPDTPQHHHSHSRDTQSFSLLEKVKASLAATQTKTVSPRMGCEGSGSYKKGSRTVDGTLGNVGAPSTLSPYLAKQLSTRLEGSVGFSSNQEEDPAAVSQESEDTNQPCVHLLRNVSLLLQDSEGQGNTRQRRPKLPKRLSYYYAGSDEGNLKSKCRSVAVSCEWILGGGESCPRPHPKNVRYLDEYRVKERRPDGTIVAVPCSNSPLDTTTITTITTTTTTATQDGGKARVKKVKKCVLLENGKDNNSLCKKKKVQLGSQNGVDSVNKNLNSAVKIQRKQKRMRGKKKKNKGNSEGSTL